MEFAGTIEARVDPPGLSRPDWIELIAAHDDLRPAEPRQMINPFTGQPKIVPPRPGFAWLVIDDQEVGTFDWAQNEENLLIVCGELSVVRSHAEAIAIALGGTFISSDRSDT